MHSVFTDETDFMKKHKVSSAVRKGYIKNGRSPQEGNTSAPKRVKMFSGEELLDIALHEDKHHHERQYPS